jgi:hypothetical protein
MGQAEELKTFRIKGVEIFSAGEWNKDKYSVSDLHNMVQAFENLKDGFKPYLKLGHDNDQKLARSSGLPSIGWVERIYVQGQKLLADLEHIPEKVFKLIKSKAYRKVSCEVYWDLDVNGVKYPRVLGALALLGAETPGVGNLQDILGLYTQKSDVVFKAFEKDDTFKTYEQNFQPDVGNEMTQEEMEKLQAELEAQKKEYATLETTKSDLEKLAAEKDKELDALRAEKAQALADAQAAKIAKFTTELESKKLVTPAMKSLVTDLLMDKKEYALGEKKLTREEAIEQILTLSNESAKVNFDENSRSDFAKKEDKQKELDGKIEKYQQENKCTYAQAVKAVMKDMKPEEKQEE